MNYTTVTCSTCGAGIGFYGYATVTHVHWLEMGVWRSNGWRFVR